MDYLIRNVAPRKDPRLLLPQAKSVIVAAARYPGKTHNPAYSSYAQGQDYHKVLKPVLHKLADHLAIFLGQQFKYRVCVDTAPILEREWAVRAGLGWIGRQGSLVNPQHGCRLFLGEIILTLHLPSATPVHNQCGDCRLCLDACPNNAFTTAGFLDAARCLSYLTIEHHGPLPHHLLPLKTASVFGCDACTAVCPFNPPEDTAVLPELMPTQQAALWPGPAECIKLDQPGFKKLFSGTPINRLGLARLQRNAAAILNLKT